MEDIIIWQGFFPGAVIEADVDNLNNKIEEALLDLDEIKSKSKKYSREVLSSGEKIAEIVINEANKKN